MKQRLVLNRAVVGTMLPDMPDEARARLARRLLTMTRQEERPLKKKLSAALVLAMVIALIAIGALAAVLLGGKDFVDKVLAPLARQDSHEKWDRKDLEEIRRMAVERGLQLSDDLLERLSYTDSEYKEELMRAFAREELGFYPSTWSIEDQHWYNQLLVDSGLSPAQEHALVEPGEISQENAISLAHAYLHDKWGADPAQLADSALYVRHLQYLLFKENVKVEGKRWDIYYSPLKPELDHYGVSLFSDGRVIEDHYRPGIGKADTRVREVFDAYRDIHGNMWEWNMEVWIACRQDMLKAAALTGEGDSASLKAIMRQTYALPEAGMVSADRAVEIGLEAAAADGYAYANEPLHSAVLLADGDRRIWKVRVQGLGGENLKYKEVEHLAVELDAYTGEVLLLQRYRNGEYGWAASYVLKSLAPEAPADSPPLQASQVNATPRPDGKPGLWYSDLAPQWFWEALDKVGYNAETGSEMTRQWTARYGQDRAFWPLEAQAIDHLWHGIQGGDVFHGLPGPDDMTQEEALAAARQAVLNDPALGISAAELDALTPAYVFRFNSVGRGSRSWDVIFCDMTGLAANPRLNVEIDAVTREVIGIQDGRLSNG